MIFFKKNLKIELFFLLKIVWCFKNECPPLIHDLEEILLNIFLFLKNPACFPCRPDFCVKMQIVHSGTVYAVLAPKNGKACTEKVLVRVPGRFLFGVLMSKISPAGSFVLLLSPAIF